MTKRVYKYATKGTFLSAFRYKNIMMFGGPVKDLGTTFPWSMIIKLDKDDVPFPIVQSSGRKVFGNLVANLQQSVDTPVLNIPCFDGLYPDLPESSWRALAADIKQFSSDNKDKELEIAVCCFGGHGRTGLALAILKHFLLNEKEDAIVSIRRTYSPQAVETLTQVRYVETITGIKSHELGSYAKKAYSGGGYVDYKSTFKDGYKDMDDEDLRYSDYWTKKAIEAAGAKKDFEDETKSQIYSALAKGIEEGEYELTPIDDTGSFSSVAGKAAGMRKGTNSKQVAGFVTPPPKKYPVHRADACIGSECPDKDSIYQIHCSKKSATRNGIVLAKG
jgi:hypothetical protein